MLFSYNWLNELTKKDLPEPEEIEKKLPLRSFEVEELRVKGEDVALDVDITSNRVADASSHFGLAKECGFLADSLPVELDFSVKIEEKEKEAVEVDVSSKKCLRYMAAVITNVKVGESPKWVKEKLLTCGLQPINNVVDLANYVMLEVGQPLHVFDLDKLEGKKIVIREAREEEKMTTLDGKEVDLEEDMLVICDAKSPVAVAGIKGGVGAEVDGDTKKIVIEAANFDPASIRKTSQKIKIRTDASWRFEHDLDPNLAEKGLNRMINLLQKEFEVEKVSSVTDCYPRKRKPKKLTLNIERVNSLLGERIEADRAVDILNKLGFKAEGEDLIEVEVPTVRTDIEREVDLIEEVGRIYGYGKIKEKLPRSVIVPPEKNLDVFWEEFFRDELKEAGFAETYNYSFISDVEVDLFDFEVKNLLEVQNPLSKRYKYLAPSLLPGLLRNVKVNLKNRPCFQVFELGKVFAKKGLPEKRRGEFEARRLSGVLVGKKPKDSFYDLKGVVESLFENAGMTDLQFHDLKPGSGDSFWDFGKSAEITMRDKKLGIVGVLSSEFLKKAGVEESVSFFTLDFETFQDFVSFEKEYEVISPYPSARRDIAVLVPREVKVAQVLNVMNRAGGELVRDIDIFDFYAGPELPEGKKNLAFHVIYQASDRTLKAEEINTLHEKIVEAVDEEGWEVRR